MKDDALEEVAEGHVFEFGNGLEDFEQTLLETHACLDALDFDGFDR
jgi:hypothetical protein